MPSLHISGLSEDEKELYKQRAEQQGCSLAEFGRRAFRVSTNLWGAEGEFNRRKFDQFFSADQPNEYDRIRPQSRESHELTDAILRELSTEEPTDFDEILEYIEPLVKNALKDLKDEGQIDYLPEEGYIKDD